MGPTHRQDRPGSPPPRGQPPPATRDFGPPVSEAVFARVLAAIDEVAKETGKSVPQIALNWVTQRPTVSSVIIGARDEKQLRENLGAIGWALSPAQIAKLDAASEEPLRYPYWHQHGSSRERNPFPTKTEE